MYDVRVRAAEGADAAAAGTPPSTALMGPSVAIRAARNGVGNDRR